MSIALPQAIGQTATDAAMKDYQDTLVRASAADASGDSFEAVRLYERAGRVAYNNKLDVDRSALGDKLKAARAARDNPVRAPPAPMVPAPGPASSTHGVPDGPGLTPARDYDQTVDYGDRLAAAGQYQLAVIAYERARRLAYNHKLATDSAALDARIAAAAKARDIKVPVSAELVPPPPPPIPHAPGEEELVLNLSDHPGKFQPWDFHHEGFVISGMHATAAELQALDGNLQRLLEVIKRTPLLASPMGFDVYNGATLGAVESPEELKAHLLQGLPLIGDLTIGFPAYFGERVRSKSSGQESVRPFLQEELACGLRFNFNSPPIPGVGYDDAEGTIFAEPLKDGEIAGQPVYGDTLIIAPPGTRFWVPVPTRRVLKVLLPEYKKAAASGSAMSTSSRKANEDVLSPEAMARRRAEEAEARAKGGAGAEQNAHHLEVMHRRWEEDARKALAAGASEKRAQERAQIYRDAQALLDSGNAAVLDAPACAMIPPFSGLSDWKLLPAGTSGCTNIVTSNSRLRNPRLPRSALQILHLTNVSKIRKELEASSSIRESPGDCVAAANFVRQMDWPGLAALLER